MELVSSISSAKISSRDVDEQLPPLLSMAIEGFPPLQQSKHVHDAERLVKEYVERWQIISFDAYGRVGLSCASYSYPGVIGADRLVIISILWGCLFLLDDLIFDSPDEFLLDQYGIDRTTRDSPHRMLEYLDHLLAVLGQLKPPHGNLPASGIEAIMWELGREMLQLSNPEWLATFVEGVMEFWRATVASHADIAAGHNLCVQDLESYTVMRAGNVGGKFVQLATEFAHNTYLPNALRSHPYVQKVTTAASIYLGFVNDIFSYHKESSVEAGINPRNLIMVLMESEGKSLVQAVHVAIELVNKYARTILDLESEAWNSVLQHHLQVIKALISGNFYFYCMDKRYRHPDSTFPELRDMTTSWKLN